MTAQTSSSRMTSTQLEATLDELRRRKSWEEAAALARELPAPLEPGYLGAADAIAFALGQAGQHDHAIALLEAAVQLEETARRASALAYLHYSAALDRRKKEDRNGPSQRDSAGKVVLDELRRGFHRWMSEALRFNPRSIKDLYRLGIFEAQVEAAHDKQALRAFLAAIDAYRALPPAERARRHDLAPYYHRGLYAGARSALRLRHLQWARRLAFDCIREDQASEHVAGVYKFALAGRVCLATGELDAAERAFRIALDAQGPRQRDFVHLALSEVWARRSDFDAAIRWIEDHIRETRRTPLAWRRLGELHERAGRYEAAEPCFTNALRGDRMGRHKTLGALARVRVAKGDWKEAERALRDSIEFRRRRYNSEDTEVMTALARVLRHRSKVAEAEELEKRVAALVKPRRRRT